MYTLSDYFVTIYHIINQNIKHVYEKQYPMNMAYIICVKGLDIMINNPNLSKKGMTKVQHIYNYGSTNPCIEQISFFTGEW